MLLDLIPSRRTGFFLIFLACAGAMAFALYAQHVMGLEPCPLCIFQRVAVMAIGGLALLAAVWNPSSRGGAVAASGLVVLAALGGAGVAGWHVRLQHLPADQVPACGPGLDYMIETMPFSAMLAKVFRGSGECAEVTWRLLGLSMPEWTLAFFAGAALFAVLLALKPRRR